MRSVMLIALCLVSVQACTESQDLGDRELDDAGLPIGDGDGAGDGEQAAGDGEVDRPGQGADPIGFDPEDVEQGEFESFAVASAGLNAESSYYVSVTASSTSGAVGCALAGDFAGDPGEASDRVWVRFESESGDARCPDGVFAITSDVENCVSSSGEISLGAGCAIYQRWDASGEEVATLFGSGGAVAITSTDVSETEVLCHVETSVRFAGGGKLEKTFEFSYDPGLAGPSSCTH